MTARTRSFFRVDGRQTHVQVWGDGGPVVVALHGSPQSSRAVAAPAAALVRQGLRVIAPDTPGNGLSDPLTGAPETVDYARALAALLDAMGVGRVGLYGFHTGAATASVFAALYPGRVTGAVLDGLPAWTDAERDVLLAGYLPPFQPAWDGSHLAWLWARLEEQTVFFPWHTPTPAARMSYDVPSVEALQANATDFLDAGDAYRAPYRAAFVFQAGAWLPRVTAPTLIAATSTDPLRIHLDRLPLSERTTRIFADGPALHGAAAAFIAQHPGDAWGGGGAPDARIGFTAVEGGRLGWRAAGAHLKGRPLVLLHDAGGQALDFDLSGEADRPVVALDLPGHGLSHDAWEDAPASLADMARCVGGAIAGMGLDRAEVAGRGAGARIAAELKRSRADGEGLQAEAAGDAGRATGDRFDWPSLEPQWDGAHLISAFRLARWRQLFAPWNQRTRAHAIPQGDLDPARIHVQAVGLIKARRRARQLIRYR